MVLDAGRALGDDTGLLFFFSLEEVGTDYLVGRHGNTNGEGPSGVIDHRPNRSPDDWFNIQYNEFLG